MVSGDLLAMGVEWRSGSQAAGRRVDYKRLWSSGEQSRAGLGTEGRASSWVEAGKELVDVLGSHLWGVTSVPGGQVFPNVASGSGGVTFSVEFCWDVVTMGSKQESLRL